MQKADAEGAAEVFAPYLTAAERLGYLKTAGESEVLSLNPAEILTRSTAAELLAAAAGLDGDVLATFAPEDASLPASAAAMDSLGILDCENPSAPHDESPDRAERLRAAGLSGAVTGELGLHPNPTRGFFQKVPLEPSKTFEKEE